MSTQDAEFSMPLVYSYDQAPVRLMELPPSLVSLIENATNDQNGSDKPILKIKAPSGPNATPNAYLCTATETYQIRNVHTSNAMFLLQPTLVTFQKPSTDSDDEDVADNDSIPKQGVAITSTCGAYLELIAQKSTAAAAAQVNSLLGVYTGPEYVGAKPADGMSKEDIGRAVPVSDAEFSQIWEDSGAFEVGGDWAMKLSADSALRVFKEVVRGSMEFGLKVFNPDGVGMSDIVEAMDKDEGWPEEGAKVVIRSVAEKVVGEDGSISWRIDPKKAAVWVGKQLLEAHKGKKITKSDFLELWKTSSPEECTDTVDIALIEPYYDPKEAGSIQITGLATAAAAAPAVKAPAEAASNTTTAAKASARKWHDRFKK